MSACARYPPSSRTGAARRSAPLPPARAPPRAAVPGDVPRAAADDDERHRSVRAERRQRLEQQVDPLVGLEVAHVQRERAVDGEALAQVLGRGARPSARGMSSRTRTGTSGQRARALSARLGQTASTRSQARRVRRTMASRAPRRNLPQRGAADELVDHVGVHVADHGGPVPPAQPRRGEDRLLHGVHDVVAARPGQPEEGGGQGEVAGELLRRKADRDVAHQRRRRGPQEPQPGEGDVLALVVDQQVDRVAERAELLGEQPDGDRRPRSR